MGISKPPSKRKNLESDIIPDGAEDIKKFSVKKGDITLNFVAYKKDGKVEGKVYGSGYHTDMPDDEAEHLMEYGKDEFFDKEQSYVENMVDIFEGHVEEQKSTYEKD